MLLAALPGFSQQTLRPQRYTHFPWTYDRTVSAGIGAEGTAFTFLGRVRPDTLSGYTALAIPIAPIRGAIGGYYNQHFTLDQQIIEYGLGYNLFLPFSETANLRLGVQQNWHTFKEVSPAEAWKAKPDVMMTSTDFSALIRRDHLLFGLSMENALNKGQRQYNMMLGFRELETTKWLRSSPFLLMQLREGQTAPELRFNYTATVANTAVLGASYYKNSYYSWGANAGLKLFKAVWIVAGADFKEYTTQPDALEVGLRLNFGKGRVRSEAEEAVLSPSLNDEGL